MTKCKKNKFIVDTGTIVNLTNGRTFSKSPKQELYIETTNIFPYCLKEKLEVKEQLCGNFKKNEQSLQAKNVYIVNSYCDCLLS